MEKEEFKEQCVASICFPFWPRESRGLRQEELVSVFIRQRRRRVHKAAETAGSLWVCSRISTRPASRTGSGHSAGSEGRSWCRRVWEVPGLIPGLVLSKASGMTLRGKIKTLQTQYWLRQGSSWLPEPYRRKRCVQLQERAS